MEISSNNQQLRKKRKRKKKPNENGLQAIVKPECFDGVTNWTKLQKVRSLLSHTSTFLLGLLVTFVHFLTILCDIIYQTLAQVQSCLSCISQKVLEKATKERVPETSNSEGTPRFIKRPYKKKRGNKAIQNKNPNKKMKTVGEFKFGFDARRESNSADTDVNEVAVNDNDEDGIDSAGFTKTVALDCEMVGTGPKGKDSMLARVSIVNAFGNCIYDEFVKPKEKVTDYRTEVSGVRPGDLTKGKELYEVQKDVLTIINGRRVVGHDLKHDFDVLFMSHPRSLTRDTSKYKPFREFSNGRTPSLKKLAAVVLNLDFQKGEHNSIQDAQVAMMLYLKHKNAWERSLKRKGR